MNRGEGREGAGGVQAQAAHYYQQGEGEEKEYMSVLFVSIYSKYY